MTVVHFAFYDYRKGRKAMRVGTENQRKTVCKYVYSPLRSGCVPKNVPLNPLCVSVQRTEEVIGMQVVCCV